MIEWLLYFQFINDNIDTINVLLGIAILAFPIFTEIKHPKRQHPLPPKHEILRIWRTIPRPTFSGWVFISCVILAYLGTQVKSKKDNLEKLAFQKDIKNGQIDVLKADSAYQRKLEDFGAGLIRRDTIYMQQLNKWGLTIKDSLIVKKEGNILIRPDSNFIVIDTVNGVQCAHFYISNGGSVPAKNVTIEIRYVLKDDLKKSYPLSIIHHTFGVNELWIFHSKDFKVDYKSVFFVYKIAYKNENKSYTEYYTVGYSDIRKEFGISSARFGHLFK